MREEIYEIWFIRNLRTFSRKHSVGTIPALTGSPVVEIGGANQGDFSVASQPSSPIAAAGQTTFQVTFDPSGEGLRIANSDTNENPYDFTIRGPGHH